MTFEELILQSINMCLEAEADTSYIDNEEAILQKISNIAETIEGIYTENSAEWDMDSKSRSLLQDVIDTGKGAPGIGYNSFSEMADKLYIVKTAYMLNKELMKYQERLTVYSYEYAADQSRFKSYAKASEGLLYVLESNKEDKEHAVMFSKDSLTFVKFKKNGSFQLSDKLKVPFDQLIGVCPGYYSEENDEQIDIVVGTDDTQSWRYCSFELGSMDDDIICDILDSIICNRHNLNSAEEVAEHYAKLCHMEYETVPELSDMRLSDYWKIITVLGEKAFSLNESYCKDILLSTYQKQKSRARLDKDINVESVCRRRILALTDSLEEQEHRRVKITKKRQIVIPERLYDLMKFGEEAELIYEEGKLYLSPIVLDTVDKESELLLEELVAMGISGDELIQCFKAGIIPEKEGVENGSIETMTTIVNSPEPEKKEENKKPRRVSKRKKDEEDDIIY